MHYCARCGHIKLWRPLDSAPSVHIGVCPKCGENANDYRTVRTRHAMRGGTQYLSHFECQACGDEFAWTSRVKWCPACRAIKNHQSALRAQGYDRRADELEAQITERREHNVGASAE